MSRLFGTDGVRGIANQDLDSILAFNIGRITAYLLEEEIREKPRICIGMDTRISSNMLEASLVAGICSIGGEAVVLGVVPTPTVAYLIKRCGYDAGIVISASHNSFEYNGIKIFDNKGYKISNEMEDRIQEIIEGGASDLPRPIGKELGKKTIIDDAVQIYLDYLKKTIDVDLRGMKIAVDCANGSSYIAVPSILANLGARIIVINNKPNGININDGCGSTHTEKLEKIVVDEGCHVGLAFDGDADRLIAVDNNGKVVDGDHIMAICAKHMKIDGKLKKDTLVTTVMSNIGLELALKRMQCSMVRTDVGDKYVLREMIDNGYNLGGEQSGHIIFLDYNTTGDGLLTALQLLSIIKKSKKKLSELRTIMHTYPQVLVNARVKNKHKYKYMEDKDVKEAIKDLESKMKDKGRVLIRPSGTEPLVRVMIEGQDKEQIEEYAKELASLIESKFK